MSAGGSNGPRGLSLHIGVNEVDPAHYAGWNGPLKLCEADAALMSRIATERGFEPRLLTTRDATRGAVTAAIGAMATRLVAGDFCLVTYAGHGGQVGDVNGDEEDLKDETWCLWDGQLLDDELAMLWSGFAPGVRILLLSDSCNSGSIAKGEGDAAEAQGPRAPDGMVDRAMPREAARATFREQRGRYARIQRALPDPMPRIRASIRQLSGCADGQKSYDGQQGHGIFTDAVSTTLREGGGTAGYRAFYEALHARMPDWQKPAMLTVGAPDPAFDAEAPLTI